MQFVRRATAAVLGLLALAGCRFPELGHGQGPRGDVVAVVGGHEITAHDLSVEAAASAGPGAIRKPRVRLQLLNTLVSRTILSDEAIAEGLDRSADFAARRRRAAEIMLVDALKARIAADVPAPTQAEADAFAAGHPEMFADRRMYVVDELRISLPADRAALSALAPLKTMAEVQARLDADHLAYERGVVTLDALAIEPRWALRLAAQSTGEIDVLSAGDSLLIFQVRDRWPAPVNGQSARSIATDLLRRERTRAMVDARLSRVLEKGLASARFNPAYGSRAGSAALRGPPPRL